MFCICVANSRLFANAGCLKICNVSPKETWRGLSPMGKIWVVDRSNASVWPESCSSTPPFICWTIHCLPLIRVWSTEFSIRQKSVQNAKVFNTSLTSHFMSQVIGNRGLLRRKTRILITKEPRFLQHTDYILVMKNHSIVDSGTFEELNARQVHSINTISAPNLMKFIRWASTYIYSITF